jgi:hypothetical protein
MEEEAGDVLLAASEKPLTPTRKTDVYLQNMLRVARERICAARLDIVIGNTEIIEALYPPVESVSPGNNQQDRRDGANARAVIPNIGPFKEGQVCTWTTL